MRWFRALRSAWVCDAGATAIEAALTLVLLVTVMFGIVEFAFGYWILNDMQSAIAAGGRYAIAHRLDSSGNCQDPTDSTQVNPTAQQVAQNMLPNGLTFGPSSSSPYPSANCSPNATCCPKGTIANMTITVTYSNSFLSLFGINFGATDKVPLI